MSNYVDYGAQQAELEQEHERKFGRRHSHDLIYDIWSGHLAGFYLNGDDESNIYLEHAACGWQAEQPRGGFPVTHTSPKGYDFGTFLANVVNAALEHECPQEAKS
jgi:hypothetical protein